LLLSTPPCIPHSSHPLRRNAQHLPDVDTLTKAGKNKSLRLNPANPNYTRFDASSDENDESFSSEPEDEFDDFVSKIH